MVPTRRLPAALRNALAKLQAGADPTDVAAELIRKRAEGAALRANLPAGDARQPLLDLLVKALGARTFDDSAITLEDCLRGVHEGEEAPLT